MSYKTITLFIVVVVLLGSVTAYFMQNPNEPTDTLRTELRVGDSTTTYETTSLTMTENSDDPSQMIELLYTCDGEPTGEYKDILFAGETVRCMEYYDEFSDDRFYIEPATGICYQFDYDYVLLSLYLTNMDLTKTKEEQTVSDGNFLMYYGEGDRGLMEYTSISYRYESGVFTGILIEYSEGEKTVEIEEITASGDVRYKGQEYAVSAANYLSRISYKSAFEYNIDLEDVKERSMEKAKAKTNFGERTCIVEDDVMENSKFVFVYGMKDVLYGMGSTGTIKFEDRDVTISTTFSQILVSSTNVR